MIFLFRDIASCSLRLSLHVFVLRCHLSRAVWYVLFHLSQDHNALVDNVDYSLLPYVYFPFERYWPAASVYGHASNFSSMIEDYSPWSLCTPFTNDESWMLTMACIIPQSLSFVFAHWCSVRPIVSIMYFGDLGHCLTYHQVWVRWSWDKFAWWVTQIDLTLRWLYRIHDFLDYSTMKLLP